MDLSVIIVSYNTKDILIECINSIYKHTQNLNFEVIVYDNASGDGTVDELAKLPYETLTIIENGKNLGFSKANNVGLKISGGKYVLFLNSDTLVKQGVLKGMAEFMDENKKAGAATCKVVLPNGKIDDASHRGFPTPWNALVHFSGISKLLGKTRLFGGYNMGYMDLNKTHQIDALAGAFMLVRRQAGEEAGWWDEDYFFYGEDLDFCYMLKKAGWKIYYVPKYKILHYKGVSGGIKKISKNITVADKNTKRAAKRARFNAMRIFYKKHYENKYPWFVTRLVYLGIYLKQILS
jgi:GT2 family glycosyltransferase